MTLPLTAILLAGQRPGPDPLAAAFGGRWKALVPVAGEPMVAHVARTLLATPGVARVLVLAQEPDAIIADPGAAWLGEEPRAAFAASQAGIAASVANVAGRVAAPWPVLVTTADHVLLTPAMIEAFVAGAGDADVAAAVVEARVLRAAYPDSRRTWLRFRGGAYSGANLFLLAGERARPALDLWAGVERDRKKGWRLLARIGPALALGAALRLLTLDRAVALLGHRLGLAARVVALPQAEAAIDVDKPSDHAQVEAILAERDGR